MLVCEKYDNDIRWKEGERLENLFEEKCNFLSLSEQTDHLAVDAANAAITYIDLDSQANKLARYLLKQGFKSGDRIGLMFDKSPNTYVAMLAVLKINAAYVPLDPSFPHERVSFIAKDSGMCGIITLSKYSSNIEHFTFLYVFLDDIKTQLETESGDSLDLNEKGEPIDQLCYIIYTSGTTGNPKGVAIDHESICNFVRVACEVYGYKETDRVYQGMTIAFDFSVEELWVPLVSGSTLIPCKPETNLVGNELAEYLVTNKVTAMCCVPTLLATIEEDLPDLRWLLVSGEACPQDLITRWSKPGRTILNAYGPTEATVTATWSIPAADKPITIGGPLPTYTIVVLDENHNEVPDGEIGEICIAGIGLARGYVNREDLTKKSFIPDLLDIPNNPCKRIYKSGDLGRINEQNEVEYLGRIDTQVKIRGYRIELTEIESVLMQVPGILQAVVSTHTNEDGIDELVAYCTLEDNTDSLPLEVLSETLRSHLPAYMVPSYIEHLDEIPMSSSHKADRKKLPPPQGARFVVHSNAFVAPTSDTEKLLAALLRENMNINMISVTDHFFDDLGAHSLLMAQYCATVREHLPYADVSMRDIYQQPTIADLASEIDSRDKTADNFSDSEPYHIASKLSYYNCGALQLFSYVGYFLFGFWIAISGLAWILEGTNWLEYFARSVGFIVAVFTLSLAVPVLAKQLLIGKWDVEIIPIWSLKYFRFWLVKTLISMNPLVMFKGLPLFNVYLRMLGAKIGKHVVYEGKHVPVCTDLISIGDNTLIRRDTKLLGYKARAGSIFTGPVTIGSNVYVGESAVLDIFTEMGDNTQLGHVSLLKEHQQVPSGKHYHGSPAVETTSNYCAVEAKICSSTRRAIYSSIDLINLFITAPIIFATVFSIMNGLFVNSETSNLVLAARDFVTTLTIKDLASLSIVLFFGFMLINYATVMLLPKLLNIFIKEGKTYVLFGVHFWTSRFLRGVSNSKFFNTLFGDSSAVVYYLRDIGYKFPGKLIQTGSNFGVEMKHDNPRMCSFGSGTMVADGLNMSNLLMSSTSFQMQNTILGANNYLGNNIYYPPNGKTGNNCLLGTKVMIPIDGDVVNNVGLLGSPCFEIPRMVERDKMLGSHAIDEDTRKKKLYQKNIHNLITASSFLFVHWLFSFLVLLIVLSIAHLSFSIGIYSLLVGVIVAFVFYLAYYITMERVSMQLAALKPQITSIYDVMFWRVERYWKHSEDSLKELFVGTPFKNIITRLCGTKVGKMVYDDGLIVTEKGMVEIGDYCTFNADSTLQSHSLEEGVFKCDYIKVEAGCTVCTNALVHYGTTLEEGSVIESDSFFMKGETAKTNTIWQGNPAKQI